MRKFKAVYAKQYTKQDGTNGTSWKNLGFANEVVNQEGKTTIHLSLDAIPTGVWDGEIKLFLQDENNQQNQGGQQQQSHQAPQQQSYQAPTQYVNQQGQITDENGQLILGQNGQSQYAQK